MPDARRGNTEQMMKEESIPTLAMRLIAETRTAGATSVFPLFTYECGFFLFSRSVLSDSFATPWTVACQVLLVHRISQARVLE